MNRETSGPVVIYDALWDEVFIMESIDLYWYALVLKYTKSGRLTVVGWL